MNNLMIFLMDSIIMSIIQVRCKNNLSKQTLSPKASSSQESHLKPLNRASHKGNITENLPYRLRKEEQRKIEKGGGRERDK